MNRERVKLRSFGEKLKIIRKQHGLTQEVFAEKMCVSLDTVKNWEQSYNYPSIDMLIKIAEYFQCDIDYLIGQQKSVKKEFPHISDMIGISEVAAARLIKAKEEGSPIPAILSDLIEDDTFLISLYACASANYGSVSAFVDVVDPFQPSGKRATLVSPQRIRQADTMNLFIELQVFIDKLREKYGLPTSTEEM